MELTETIGSLIAIFILVLWICFSIGLGLVIIFKLLTFFGILPIH